MVSSCITMEAVIYGWTDNANSVARENASPDMMFRYWKIDPLAELKVSARVSEFTNGTGITAPRR